MTLEAYQRRDWTAVIAAHPLESHDPEEWLRYGVALLQTLTPGPDVGKQQQQAALAFVQAQKEGASAEAVASSQRAAALMSLAEAVVLAGIDDAVVDHCLAVAGRSGRLRVSSQESSQGGESERLLMIIAGFFGLRVKGDAAIVTQILDVKSQLLSKGVDMDEVERRIHAAVEGQPDLQGAILKQLFDLLK